MTRRFLCSCISTPLHAGAVSLLLVAAACRDSTGGNAPPPTPAHIALVGRDTFSARVGEMLPAPVVVRVTDTGDHPVGGASVHFKTLGGATPLPHTTITDAQGLAQARFRVSRAAWSEYVEAQVLGPGGEVLALTAFHVVSRPGPPAKLTSDPSFANGARGSIAQPLLSVHVMDEYGNSVPGVPVTWTVLSGGGTITPQLPTTTNEGLVQAAWTLGPVIGNQTARAAVAPGLTADFTAWAQ